MFNVCEDFGCALYFVLDGAGELCVTKGVFEDGDGASPVEKVYTVLY